MIALLMALSSSAQAANWVALQNLEPSDPDKAGLRAWGFVQVLGEGVYAQPVTGLEADKLQPYNGELAVFNTVGNQGQPSALNLRRVRVGVRGQIPGTAFNTFAAVELGQNGVTTAGGQWRPALMDASITWRSPGSVHVRVGQFKTPTSDAVLEAVHMSADLLQFSVVTRRLLLERETSSDAATWTGRANGFRDVGVQVFGIHNPGPLELTWLVQGSNGTTRFGDNNPGKDVSARVQLAWQLDDGPARSPTRQEAAVWAWGVTGTRPVWDGTQAQRTRAGGGAQLIHSGLRLRGEFIYAAGMLTTGFSPPFAGNPLAYNPDGDAWGTTALASYRWNKLELGAHWAHLDSLPDGGADQRLLDEVAGFAQWHFSNKAWLNSNVVWRDIRAPEGSADAQRILDTIAPMYGLELTVIAP
ncbi:MAG: porin [Myxococcota bacterium]|nr:porin [Myxococcota bacterium]